MAVGEMDIRQYSCDAECMALSFTVIDVHNLVCAHAVACANHDQESHKS